MKLNQSNFNLRSPEPDLVCSYLIATVLWKILWKGTRVKIQILSGNYGFYYWTDIRGQINLYGFAHPNELKGLVFSEPFIYLPYV